MYIQRVKLENYTVFESEDILFGPGINVIIGENSTGKTHLLKLIYSACVSNRRDVDFGNKVVRTMMPDGFDIARLITRKKGNRLATVKVAASEGEGGATHTLSMVFDRRTKKWGADIKGKENWERVFSGDFSSFIPTKEILSNSYQLISANSVGNVRFDDTYIDIINSAKIDFSKGKNPANRKKLLEKIEKMTGGSVYYDTSKDEFYLQQGVSRQEFNLVAEGIKKMGLLWLLAKNGTLEKGSILLWDEPEANINPSYISIIAELLIEIQRWGVQVFISTHNYVLAKYIEIKRDSKDDVNYLSLYREDGKGPVYCEKSNQFTLLVNNPIVKTYLQVYRDEIGVSL